MDLGIENRIALVTGASRNIGLAISKALAAEGARVILIGRTKENLDAAKTDLPGPDGRHLFLQLDLQSKDALPRLRDALIGEFDSPDIVVHNLGGSLGITDPFSCTDRWQEVWQFNVGIAIALNGMLIPPMEANRWGRILHLSTLSTKTFNGNAPYMSAKCALEGYVKSISKIVCKNNVIMNLIAPGAISLPGRYFGRLGSENIQLLNQYFDNHLPIRRLGTPVEIARIAAFLCSEHASFMSGAVIRVDGDGY
jgi:3-oxoacyl-[acyl-carrier protein] reductase